MSQAVANCWYVPPETTVQISEPLANILDRYLPQKAKETAEVALDPLDVLGGIYAVLSQCKANEEALVANLLAARSSAKVKATEPPPEPGMEAPAVDVQQLRDDAASFDVLEEAAA